MSFAFKKFNFFQQQEIAIHQVPQNAICTCEAAAYLYVGCDNGSIQRLNETLQSDYSFSSHSYKVLFVKWLEPNTLLALGVEEPGFSSATLKLWTLEGGSTPTKPASPPPAPRSLRLFTSKFPESQITAVAAKVGHLGLITIAVGLGNGLIYVLRAEAKARPTHVSKLSARPDAGDLSAVLALELQGEGAMLSLFAVTESQTLSFNLTSGVKTVLDRQGCRGPNLAVLLPSGVLMVARDEALHEYTSDTRAGCTVLEGSKTSLAALKRYLVVVSQETSAVGISTSTVHVADVRQKVIAGTFQFINVKLVMVVRDAVAVLLGNGKLFLHTEVGLRAQIDSLSKKGLYRLALDVASSQGADEATLAMIRQRWGDALYSKGEYDAAMAQYLETLGHLEPSYVIRRFLDASRIPPLASYLERLHLAKAASADHTTLLLNCLTKLKDAEKLDAFLGRDSGDASSSTSNETLSFDAETAVRVLRGAGYYSHARWVAARAGESGWEMDILLDDMGDAEGAVKLLDTLPRQKRAEMLRKYGRTLITSLPWETTRQLMDLCIPPLRKADGLESSSSMATSRGYGPSHSRSSSKAGDRGLGRESNRSGPLARGDEPNGGDNYIASVSDFAHLYTDTPTELVVLCEFILNEFSQSAPPNEQLLYHTLLDLLLANRLADEPLPETEQPQPPSGNIQSLLRLVDPAAQTPGDWEVGSSAATSRSQAAGPSATSLTLSSLRQDRRTRAMDRLQEGWPPHSTTPRYDPHHALLLCRLHSFNPGLVFLYDRLKLPREVLQVYKESGEHANLIKAAIKYGDASKGGDPQLWAEVLEYFVEQPGDCTQQISEVISYIEQGDVLPPLVVLTTLSRSPGLTVATVRGYVQRALAREMADIGRDKDTVAKLQAETAGMKAEVSKLKNQARVFQASRCSATGAPLELPAVHFLCGHSYNVRSLGDQDRECPLCAPDFRRVIEIRRNMQAAALQPDRFFTELREASDGFSVIAEHLGRGAMNATAAVRSSVESAATRVNFSD